MLQRSGAMAKPVVTRVTESNIRSRWAVKFSNCLILPNFVQKNDLNGLKRKSVSYIVGITR